MLIRITLWAALALAATRSLAASPALPGPAFPHYARSAQLEAACSANLTRANAAVRRLEAQGPGPRWLAAYDDLNALVEDLASPVYLLSNVHPDKPMREAAEACERRWQDFFTSLGQNEKLYRAARRHVARDAIDRPLL